MLETPAARSETASESQPDRSEPQPEQVEPTPRPQPFPPAPREVATKATLESHNIQVRIERVEIRSNQPAPLARPARPSRVSGFDDLRLARNYLDRNFGR